MRARLLWVVAVALGGCDVVLGLGDPGQPAPGAEAPPRCLVPGDYVEIPRLAHPYPVAGDPLPPGGEPRPRPGAGWLARCRATPWGCAGWRELPPWPGRGGPVAASR